MDKNKPKINCAISISDDEVIITNLVEDNIKIDISGDIDFTTLVAALAEKIDESPEIELSIDDVEDEKEKLILKTISEIFQSYNDALNDDQTYEDIDPDDIPF